MTATPHDDTAARYVMGVPIPGARPMRNLMQEVESEARARRLAVTEMGDDRDFAEAFDNLAIAALVSNPSPGEDKLRNITQPARRVGKAAAQLREDQMLRRAHGEIVRAYHDAYRAGLLSSPNRAQTYADEALGRITGD